MGLLEISCKTGNDNPALVENGRMLTYSELDRRVASTARRLWTAGARPGSLVALALPPSTEQVVITRAAMRLRAIAAPLDPRAPAAELEERLAELRPEVTVRAPGDLGAVSESTDAALVDRHDPADVAVTVHTSGTSARPRP